MTIHVSNFYNARGGIIFPIDFGDAKTLENNLENDTSVEWSGILFLLLFSTLHLTIYLLRKRELAFYYSSLFMLCSAIMIMTRGERRLLLREFPNLPFEFYFRLQDSATCFAVIFILLFVITILPELMKKKHLLYLISPILSYAIALIIFPARSLSGIQYLFFYYIDILLLGIVFRLIYLILKKSWLISKNEMVVLCLMFFFLLVFATSGSIDVLFFSNSNILNRIGLLGYVILMNVFLALRLINRTDEAIQAAQNVKMAMNRAMENEMNYLQAQIKPHFLYNAISNIIALCYSNGERAAHLLTMLSSYLRYIFQSGKSAQVNFLQKELDLIDAYVELEKARFGDRLTYSYQIEDSIKPDEVKIPSLLIQPLVENAIRHGLFEKQGAGHVSLHVSKKGRELWIYVIDDGVGMTEDQCKKLMEGHSPSSGIGFTNVIRRVRELSKGNIHLHSKVGEGTTITLVLPMEEK